MIIKLITGNGFTGALRYGTREGMEEEIEVKVNGALEAELGVGDAPVPVMSPGKESEESNDEKYDLDDELIRKRAKVLDAQDVTFDYDDDGNMTIDPKQVGWDFRQQTMAYQGKGTIRKPVYHWVMSYSPKDKVTEEQMLKDAGEFLEKAGFDDTQRVTIAHYDKEHKHLHIITNIVDNQGDRISTMGLVDKAHKIAAEITKDRGYTWGEKTKKEDITPEHIHKPHDRVREIIEPIIREAKDKATSLDEFTETLSKQGITCKITQAQDGKRGGISYSYEYEGQTHPFRGSSLGRGLSFGYINQAIKNNKRNQQEATWAHYNEMRPILTEANDIVSELFAARRNTSMNLSEINAEISKLYRQYNKLYRAYCAKEKRDLYDDKDFDYHMRRFLSDTLDGGFLLAPLFIIGLAVKIIHNLTKMVSEQYAWSRYLSKSDALDKKISDLKFAKMVAYQNLAENSNLITRAIDERDSIKRQLGEIKVEVLKKMTPKEFTCDGYRIRIKRQDDGSYKLQQLEWDKTSPVVDHQYTKKVWTTKAAFASYTEIKHGNVTCLEVKDADGRTRHINLHGVELSSKTLQQLGLSKGGGIKR